MNNNYLTDSELISLINTGNRLGYNRLYKQYASILYGVINSIVTDAGDAEKILKQTFNHIGRNISSFNHVRSSFLTWMLQVARNISIAYLRDAKQVQYGCVAQANTNMAQVKLMLMTHVDIALTEHEIFAIVLQGNKAGEVAELLNIPVETVKMKIRKAMLTRVNRV